VPEVRVTASVDKPVAAVWPWVKEMDNWAPMLKGYESHEKESETESVWTLTGDLGPMSKTVAMRVTITEWVDGERVAFALTGVEEAVTGGGAFDITEDAPPPPPPPPTKGWFARLIDWLFGRKAPAPALPEPAESHVVFTFAIEAGGPMGPMINAMLGPYAEMVATELLASVKEAVNEQGAPA